MIIGNNRGSGIGTLAERQTRMLQLLYIPCRDAHILDDALRTRMAGLPPLPLRSITWDRGPRWPAI